MSTFFLALSSFFHWLSQWFSLSRTIKSVSCRHETQHKSPTTKRSKAEQKTQFRFRQNAVNRHVSGLASLRKHHSDRLEGHLTLFHVPSEWLQLTCIDFLCAIYSTHEMFCQEACVFFIKPFDFRQSLLTKQIFGCRMGENFTRKCPCQPSGLREE